MAPTAGAKRKVMEEAHPSSDRPLRQTKLFQSPEVITQKKADDLITPFVVQGMHALSTVEQMEFKDLVTGLNPRITVMSRRTLGRRIDDAVAAKLLAIKADMKAQHHVCTTADIWSTKARSYMGVTAHWIDVTNLERCSVALACRRFRGSHTYNRIAEVLDEIHNDFALTHEKIVATISDNGANFVKAFREFNIKMIHNTEANEEDDDDPDDALNFITIGDDENTAADGLQDSPVNVESAEQHTIVLPNHLRCGSHTLSLVATTDAKNALMNSAAFKRLNNSTMAKCSALWNASGRPQAAEEIDNICHRQLSSPCPTRWNSLFDCITVLLELRETLAQLMPTLGLPLFKEIELEFLAEYHETLKPIAVCLDRLQGQKSCYYGELLPTLFATQTKLEALEATDLRHCLPLLHAVIDGFKR